MHRCEGDPGTYNKLLEAGHKTHKHSLDRHAAVIRDNDGIPNNSLPSLPAEQKFHHADQLPVRPMLTHPFLPTHYADGLKRTCSKFIKRKEMNPEHE